MNSEAPYNWRILSLKPDSGLDTLTRAFFPTMLGVEEGRENVIHDPRLDSIRMPIDQLSIYGKSTAVLGYKFDAHTETKLSVLPSQSLRTRTDASFSSLSSLDAS
jgi:hypothetical protein